MGACEACGADLGAGARFCPQCAAPVQPAGLQAAPARERKIATALFADLVGSTAFADGRDAEVVRDVLERFYEAMTAEVTAAGGTIEKFIGDAVVAVFGAPVAVEDHAARALDAALEMQARMRELSEYALGLRIGVNTGELVVGRAWEGSSFASGDTMNVAARLEQAAGGGEVLVSERTAASVGDAFRFAEPTDLSAKGKTEVVRCRRLLGVGHAGRPTPRRRLPSVFVGRSGELSWLQHQLEETGTAGRPRLALVVGDAGGGKSSLVAEFTRAVAADAVVRTGRCVSYGRTATYGPFADLLRAAYAIPVGAAPHDVVAALGGNHILAVTLGAPPPHDLDPRAVAERLRVEWSRLVESWAATGPLVLVLEDLHWSTPSLTQLVERVVTEVSGPVLVIGTSRPEATELPAPAQQVDLTPLDDADVEALVHGLLDGAAPDGLVDYVRANAEGNPLFAEEIVAGLVDAGRLMPVAQGWAWRKPSDSLPVADTVQSMIAARLDLLSPDAKACVQAAAVIGREVRLDELPPLLDGPAPDITPLVQRGLVRLDGTRLVFKHALTRAVAYDCLSRAHRAHLHAVHARWLEVASGGEASPARLAQHFAAAVDPEITELAWRGRDDERETLTSSALDWLSRAAVEAKLVYDLDAAIGFLQQATRLRPDDAELWHELSRVNALKYDGVAYWTSAQRAIELTTDHDVLATMYSELVLESTFRAAMWRRRPDPALIQQWTRRTFDLARPESREQARALLARAIATDSIEDAEHAAQIAAAVDDSTLLSYALDAGGTIAYCCGRYDDADQWVRRRLALLPRFTDPDQIGQIHQQATVSALALGRIDEAEQHILAMDEAIGRLTPHHAVHVLGQQVGHAATIGDWASVTAMQEKVERAVAVNQETPCVFNPWLLLTTALAAVAQGNDAHARRLEASTEALGMTGYEPLLAAVRGRLAMVRGSRADLERAAEHIDEWPSFVYAHLLGRAARIDALVELGRREQAQTEARAASQPGTFIEPFALRVLGRLEGDSELLVRAVEGFEELGARWYAEQTRQMAATG